MFLVAIGLIVEIFSDNEPADSGVAASELTSSSSESDDESAAPTTSPTPSIPGVGDQVDTGKLQMTVESVDFKNTGTFLSPGHRYIVVDILLENTVDESVSVTVFNWELRDSEGYKYNPSLSESSLSGEVLPTDLLRGSVAFEVPDDASGFRFVYTRFLADSLVVDLGV